MSELAMVTKKKCRASGHQMSLRGVDQVAGAVQPTVQVQGTPVAAAPAEPKGPGLMRRLAEQGQQLAEHQQGGVPAATPSAAPAAPVPPPPPPAVPAGWYPDPNGALLQRYWDGAAWTEYTAPMVPGQ
ncbi:hypothetical protein C6V83_02610 [Gordonia iterans]|uniref:DUF2510 domain-containing protein n=2 Tax=Gordonia iterans TaxID=1004901 RepID=A0A2S0KJV8_9ACTN|nr:hypothetical protein C6V83_02610 [Gordonia iterans]